MPKISLENKLNTRVEEVLGLAEKENKLSTRIEEVLGLAEKKKFDLRKHDAETRSEIALKFTNCYFRLLTMTIIVIVVYNLILLFADKDISALFGFQDGILAITTAVGSPLGFVVGYYFKEGEKKS